MLKGCLRTARDAAAGLPINWVIGMLRVRWPQAVDGDGQWTRFKFDEDPASDGDGAAGLDPSELCSQARQQSRDDRAHEASPAPHDCLAHECLAAWAYSMFPWWRFN